MAAECLAAIRFCRVRVTRLEDDGTPAAGPNNEYVSDKPISLGVTPVNEAGADRTLVGGCDCILATYRGFDKLKRFDFELDLGLLEPGLLEMMLGNTAILDGSDPIGNWWTNNAFDCSAAAQPNVALEGWQVAWDDDRQATSFAYVHWIWPSTFWSIAAHSLQNDFLQPKISGFSRGNSAWGTGPYGDQPEAAQPLGGFFYTNTIPTAACGYKTNGVT